MVKLGIVRRRSLRHPRTWLAKRKHSSLLLLCELGREPVPDPEAYDSVFRLLTMPNGTWRDTTRGRFAALDQLTLDILRRRHACGSRLAVLDLAASSGVTSAEWYRILASAYIIAFTATDLWRDAVAIRGPRWGPTVILDTEGRELQYVFGPFVLPGQGAESPFYPVNRLLLRLCRSCFLPGARAALLAGGPLRRDFAPLVRGRHELTRIPLLSHECLHLLERSRGFRFEAANILEPFQHRADAIRAMNILTPVHFGETALRHGIRNCLRALKPGGILILGRSPTEDPREVRATVYAREGTGLRAAARLNGGYEMDHLVAEQVAAECQGTGASPRRARSAARSPFSRAALARGHRGCRAQNPDRSQEQ